MTLSSFCVCPLLGRPFSFSLVFEKFPIKQEKAREITRKVKLLANEETCRTLDRSVIVAERVRRMNDSLINEVDRILFR